MRGRKTTITCGPQKVRSGKIASVLVQVPGRRRRRRDSYSCQPDPCDPEACLTYWHGLGTSFVALSTASLNCRPMGWTWSLYGSFPRSGKRGDLISAQAVGFLSGTRDPTRPAHRRGPGWPGLLVTVVRLERRPDDRPTGNAYRVASERVQILLATEIQNGQTASFRADAPLHAVYAVWWPSR